MADAASVTMSVTILPDEISKTITGLSSSYTPADGTEKWYYKITTISDAAGIDLIEGAFISEEAIVDPHDTVNTADKVKFLWIKNTSATDAAYLTFDANASNVITTQDSLKIPLGTTWFGVFDNLLVSDLHARAASSKTPVLQVAAIITDMP